MYQTLTKLYKPKAIPFGTIKLLPREAHPVAQEDTEYHSVMCRIHNRHIQWHVIGTKNCNTYLSNFCVKTLKPFCVFFSERSNLEQISGYNFPHESLSQIRSDL